MLQAYARSAEGILKQAGVDATMVEDGVHSTQKSKATRNAIIFAISLALGGGWAICIGNT